MVFIEVQLSIVEISYTKFYMTDFFCLNDFLTWNWDIWKEMVIKSKLIIPTFLDEILNVIDLFVFFFTRVNFWLWINKKLALSNLSKSIKNDE